MAGQHEGYALGVDLGTSNTVAVLRWPDGRTRPLLIDGQPVFPSGVYADTDGRLHVGWDARRLAQAAPGRYEPNPKRRIDEASVSLGDRAYEPADLLAAILHAVGQAAVATVGFLPPAVLTCPASWDDARRQVLRDALLRAGWPPAAEHTLSGPTPPGTRLLREPVAAARYYAQVLRRPVPVGGSIAVFDLGGGTLDVAVLRHEGADPWGDSGFTVTATGGAPDLGGLDLDAVLVERLGELLAATHPADWERLTRPNDAAQGRDRHQLWESVRQAREMLSRATVAPVVVPGSSAVVQLTREDLERVATPLLRRAMAETQRVIAAAGLAPEQLAGLFLVGGPTRMPLVARLLHAELGIAPTVLEQPELPVAEGALTDLPAPRAATPSPLPPAATPPSPPSPPAATPPLPSAVTPPVSAGPVLGTSGRRRRTLWIAAATALAIVGAGGGIGWWLTRDSYPALEFQNLAEIRRVKAGEERLPEAFTALLGDVGYVAYPLPDDRLEIVAVNADDGTERWRARTSRPARRWERIVAVPGAVAVLADASGYADAGELEVLHDASGGERRWRRPIGRDDEVIFGRDVAVLVDQDAHRLVGLRLRDGTQAWSQANPRTEYGDARGTALPVGTAEGESGPAYPDGTPRDPWRGEADRLVLLGADRSARLLDVTSGEVTRTWQGVADVDDLVAARDDRLYVVDDAGGRYRLLGYDLTRAAEPTVLRTVPDGRRPTALVVCGEHRACLLEAPRGDANRTEVVVVSEGDQARHWAAPKAETLVPVGEHLLVGRAYPESTSTLFDPQGRTVLADRPGVAVRLDAGNLLIFADPLTSGEADRSVAGLALAASAVDELGQLIDVRGESCSWNTSVILCGAEKDFVLYRFAARS